MNNSRLFRRTFFTCAGVPVPVPLPQPRSPLALRGSVLHTDLTRSSVINSQFRFDFQSCESWRNETPIWGLPKRLHIVMGGNMAELLTDKELDAIREDHFAMSWLNYPERGVRCIASSHKNPVPEGECQVRRFLATVKEKPLVQARG